MARKKGLDMQWKFRSGRFRTAAGFNHSAVQRLQRPEQASSAKLPGRGRRGGWNYWVPLTRNGRRSMGEEKRTVDGGRKLRWWPSKWQGARNGPRWQEEAGKSNKTAREARGQKGQKEPHNALRNKWKETRKTEARSVQDRQKLKTHNSSLNASNTQYPSSSGEPSAKMARPIFSVAQVDYTRDVREVPEPLLKGALEEEDKDERAWSWPQWETWYRSRVTIKRWRLKVIQRVLDIRAVEARKRKDFTDYHDPNMLFSRVGCVYGLFHFTSKKWYVGQTINTVPHRARQHFSDRARCQDRLHEELCMDLSPSGFLMFPLQYVEQKQCYFGNRKLQRDNFRRVATPIERFWTARISSLWPRGWNTAWPGHPYRGPSTGMSTKTFIPDVEEAKKWVESLTADKGALRKKLKSEPKDRLIEVLNGMQSAFPSRRKTAESRAVELMIKQELRARKTDKDPREYIKFFFSNRLAEDLRLSEALKHPDVISKHPRPEKAAAIRVVHRFSPQIQSQLFNFSLAASKVAPDPGAMEALLNENAEACPCRQALRSQNENALFQGHVVTSDCDDLKWSYLRSCLQHGKKVRLELPMHVVWDELEGALTGYITFKLKGVPDDERLAMEAKYEAWKVAVLHVCRNTLCQRTSMKVVNPEGHPGLAAQISRGAGIWA